MSTVQLLIKGEVQGVFYRATAKKIAEKTGITGWIKNTGEGHVEAIVSGSEEQLQNFISWCKQGPAKASVNEVIVNKKEDAEFERFVIVR